MSRLPPLTLGYVDPPTGPAARLDVEFQFGVARRRVRFEAEGANLMAGGSALLCLGLVPAMELGVALHLAAPVDSVLLRRANEIQELLCRWYPGYRPIAIHAEAANTSKSVPTGRTGVFFSGGVDSSFTLLSERHRVDTLVTLVGADVSPADAEEVTYLTTLARRVADDFGKQSVILTTDIRSVSDRMIGWVEYHGALLAAVSHMLSQKVDSMLIASSADQSSWNRPWGSHPGLDPLWSATDMTIEHNGLVDRLAKIAAIVESPALMAHLRVCDYDRNNCGLCEDCNFMIQALELLGGRDRAPTYANGDPRVIRLPVTGEGSKSDLQQLRIAAERKGSLRVARAIDASMRRHKVGKALQRILPTRDLARRFRRFKRQWRYARESRKRPA